MGRLLFFLILLSQFAISDCAGQMFQKTINNNGGDDYGANIQKNNNGEYYISSTISNIPNGLDAAVIKINSIGDTIWTKIYGGPSIDFGECFLDGNQTYLCGSSDNPSFGEYDIIFMKTDPLTGDTIWTKRYGSSKSESANPPLKTIDGGFLLPAFRSTLPSPPLNWLLIKTNSFGDTLWTKEYDGGNDENSFSVLQRSNGEYILAGATNSFSSGNYQLSMSKINASGNLLVTKTFGGTDTILFNAIKPVNNGYMILGNTNSLGAGRYDVFLMKVDTNFNVVWAKTYGTTTDDQGYSLEVASNDDIIIAGRTGLTTGTDWDVYTIKTDSLGNLIWSKKYSVNNNEEWADGIVECSDLGYLMNGSCYNSSSGYDLYVIKTDSAGNSGCNQGNIATITTDITSNIVTGTGILAVSNPGLSVTSCPWNISSGLQISTLCFTGIEENNQENKSLSVYPNPASDFAAVQYNLPLGDHHSSLLIFDVTGREIGNIVLSKNNMQTEIDLSQFNGGIYFCTLVADGNVIDKTKFVVIK